MISIGKSSETKEVILTMLNPARSILVLSSRVLYRRTWREYVSNALHRNGWWGTVRAKYSPSNPSLRSASSGAKARWPASLGGSCRQNGHL